MLTCFHVLISIFLLSLSIPVQLSELVTMEGYGDWIRLVAEFTSKSLLSWQVNGLEYCSRISCSFALI